MLGLITSFSSDVERYVQGRKSAEQLIHHNNKAYEAFKDKIRGTAPAFQPYSNAVEHNSSGFNVNDGSPQYFYLDDMREHINKFVHDKVS